MFCINFLFAFVDFLFVLLLFFVFCMTCYLILVFIFYKVSAFYYFIFFVIIFLILELFFLYFSLLTFFLQNLKTKVVCLSWFGKLSKYTAIIYYIDDICKCRECRPKCRVGKLTFWHCWIYFKTLGKRLKMQKIF